jgi:nucleoside-diphosphate-sugar epimerase
MPGGIDATEKRMANKEFGKAADLNDIVDDEPAATREWLPALARALGAKPPRHIPAGLVRLIVGEDVVMGQTQARGASNAKAKGELGWTLRYPSWRQGFVAAYASTATDGQLPMLL